MMISFILIGVFILAIGWAICAVNRNERDYWQSYRCNFLPDDYDDYPPTNDKRQNYE